MPLIDDSHSGLHAVSAPPPSATVAAGPICRMCGRGPALDTTFRGHVGIVLMMRLKSLRGPFCRDCGIATFRGMTADTLVAGWWGAASFFITPAVVVVNVVQRARVGRLAPPGQVPVRTPLPAGRPLYARWQIIGALVPVALVAVVIASSGGSTVEPTPARPTNPYAHVGACIDSAHGGVPALVDCSEPHDGIVTTTVTDADDCAPISTYPLSDGYAGDPVMCVGRAG